MPLFFNTALDAVMLSGLLGCDMAGSHFETRPDPLALDFVLLKRSNICVPFHRHRRELYRVKAFQYLILLVVSGVDLMAS